eukprot:COSAG01_NODE_461_length_16698_cov_113.458160_21_plen_144_part_00
MCRPSGRAPCAEAGITLGAGQLQLGRPGVGSVAAAEQGRGKHLRGPPGRDHPRCFVAGTPAPHRYIPVRAAAAREFLDKNELDRTRRRLHACPTIPSAPQSMRLGEVSTDCTSRSTARSSAWAAGSGTYGCGRRSWDRTNVEP